MQVVSDGMHFVSLLAFFFFMISIRFNYFTS